MPREVKALTLLEFNMVLEGYVSREEEEWDRTRSIMAYIGNFAGKIAKKEVIAREIMPLRKDRAGKPKPIVSYKQAMILLDSFTLN